MQRINYVFSLSILLLIAGTWISSCNPTTKKPVAEAPKTQAQLWNELTPREQAVLNVYLDLSWAQGIEQDKRPGRILTDSVTFSRDGRDYRYANVHTFRQSIGHRWDSLRASGAIFDRDTSLTGPRIVRGQTPALSSSH